MREKKERDTVILPVRIKKVLKFLVDQKVAKKGISRNSWVIWAILQGLRSHQGKPKPNIVDILKKIKSREEGKADG